MTIFTRKQDQKQTLIEKEIADVHAQLASLTADTPEYAATLKQLMELYKIKDPNARERTTLKDWIPVIASVGSIVLIMVYEQHGHSFTSKAASFIRKP